MLETAISNFINYLYLYNNFITSDIPLILNNFLLLLIYFIVINDFYHLNIFKHWINLN